jgi:hypothetical protein
MTNTPEQEELAWQRRAMLEILAWQYPAMDYDEKAIKAALKILTVPSVPLSDEEKARCLEDIKGAFKLVKYADRFFKPRTQDTNEALADLDAAIKKAQIARAKLPPLEAFCVDAILGDVDLETLVAACENEQKYTAPLPKAGPSSHRQQMAVETAYELADEWLVQKHGIAQATSVSKPSQWHRLSQILFDPLVVHRDRKKTNLVAHMSRYKKGERLRLDSSNGWLAADAD